MTERRGVKAFQRPIRSYAESIIRQATLTCGGRELRAVSHRGGSWEIYLVRDGLELFQGYARDAIPRLVGRGEP